MKAIVEKEKVFIRKVKTKMKNEVIRNITVKEEDNNNKKEKIICY